MKILATLGLAATVAIVSQGAFASDLPNKKKAPAPIVAPRSFVWNGFYAGINGGYLSTSSNGGSSAIVGGAKGGLFGLTAGYNAQLPNNFVLGVETDYGFSNADGSGDTGTSKIESLVTARVRAGLAMDRLLPYVTGGYAGTNVKLTNVADSNTAFAGGWTAGAGAEYSFSDNLSAKAEALYISVNKETVPGADKAGFDGGLYRVGLNYHF